MSDDEQFGPPLPPGFTNRSEEPDSDGDSIGPALPPSQNVQKTRVAGPSLPPGYEKAKGNNSDSEDGSSDSDQEDNVDIGPSLPPSHRGTNIIGPSLPPSNSSERVIGPVLPSSSRTIGPSIPSQFQTKGGNYGIDEDEDSKGVIGPVLPSSSRTIGPSIPPQFETKGDNYDSDEDIIGPMPSVSKDEGISSAVADFESRSRKMKDRLTGKEEEELVLQRESWMLELPSQTGAGLGLTARTFRTRDRPQDEDRSVWTDTPADRERKLKEGPDNKKRKVGKEEYLMSKKERKLAAEVEAYNKSQRPDSLLEMHQKKMKKKKKKEKDKPKERRPFDRELDLKVNQLDDAKKTAIIKRSQQLNSRFKSGGTGTQFL